MLNSDDVIGVYRELLERNPENEDSIQHYIKMHKSIDSMIRVIKKSAEFKYKYMQKNLPEKVVIFLHIPKTAGTHLREAWLYQNVYSHFWHNEGREYPTIDILQRDYIEASSYQLLGGHQHIETFLKMKIVQPRIFLATLREPIARIISYYNYLKNNEIAINSDNPLIKLVQSHSLYELLEGKTNFYKSILNEQIRYLIPNTQWLDKFSDRDIMILGRQDNVDEFVRVSNEIIGFKYNAKDICYYAGEKGYEKMIEAEEDFPKALEVMKEITLQESRLYNSIKKIRVMNKNEYIDFVQEFQIAQNKM